MSYNFSQLLVLNVPFMDMVMSLVDESDHDCLLFNLLCLFLLIDTCPNGGQPVLYARMNRRMDFVMHNQLKSV